MKQRELAKKLKVSQSLVSMWVTGRVKIAGIYAIALHDMTGKKIGEILDMKPEKLKKLIKSIQNKEE